MSAQDALGIASAVVLLTQMIKGMGLPNRWGSVVVLGLSALGVILWGISAGNFDRSQLFGYFAGWANIAFAAAGVWGYVRATRETLTSFKSDEVKSDLKEN